MLSVYNPSKKRKSTSMRKVIPTRTRALTKRVKSALVKSVPSRNCHSFKRWGNVERYDVAGNTNGGLTFSLSDVQGYAEFEALYDRYMLTGVAVRFRIINNPDAAGNLNTAWAGIPGTNVPTANWFPRLFYCPDYDDASAETLSALRERAKTKMKILRPNSYVKMFIKPACTIQTYYTSTGAGYAPKWKQWIDMGQSGVPHYGMKWVADCSGLIPNSTYPFKLEIEKQYYFKCKDVR